MQERRVCTRIGFRQASHLRQSTPFSYSVVRQHCSLAPQAENAAFRRWLGRRIGHGVSQDRPRRSTPLSRLCRDLPIAPCNASPPLRRIAANAPPPPNSPPGQHRPSPKQETRAARLRAVAGEGGRGAPCRGPRRRTRRQQLCETLGPGRAAEVLCVSFGASGVIVRQLSLSNVLPVAAAFRS